MSCYYPIRAYTLETGGIVFDEKKRHGNITGQIDVACGQCTGCRMQRVADWTVRIIHESQMWKENSFITLTYGPGNLPPNASLEHRDYQLFMKRLSKQEAKNGKRIRFHMCGEYGDETGRPHYHACIFNHAFSKERETGKSGSGEIMYESTNLNELWGMGICTTQDLTAGTAAYCAGYIMKKQLGQESKTAYGIITEDGEYIHREPPYSKGSLKPGIGKAWFDKYGHTDVTPHGFILQDGVKKRIPPYYLKLIKRQHGGELPNRLDQIRAERMAAMPKSETTPERLAVKEEIHKAKIRNLNRDQI